MVSSVTSDTPTLHEVSADSVVLDVAGGAPPGPLDLLLDGRRIWSFRVEDTRPLEGTLRSIDWPEAVRPFLHGSAGFALRRVGAAASATVRASLGGEDAPLRFVDEHARPLVVNKWGRVGRALGDGAEGTTARLLDRAEAVVEALRPLGLDAFVTGGTLLGAVREGRLLGHDDDVDLGYISRHTHPVEVAREGYAVGRALCRAGFSVLRHSPGHVQVHFSHDGTADHYVDVFAGFLREGAWHQLFCIRHPAHRADLLPRSTVEIEGRSMPSPRNTELALEANYGPGWRVPDPAFRFSTPPGIRRRLDNWFPGCHGDREEWEQQLLAEPAAIGPSDLARDVAAGLDPPAPVLDLGCGRAADARWLAVRGHPVVGVDWARRALDAVAPHERLDLRVVNLYDPRPTVALAAGLAAGRRAWTVLARRVLERLAPSGRANALRLVAMVLRTGGRLHLELGEGPVTAAQLVREAAAFGLCTDGIEQDGPVTRMEMTWTARH